MKTSKVTVFFIIAFAMLYVVNVQAQEKGDMAAGADLVYGTGDSFSNYGIGAKFRWSYSDQIRLEPSFTYYMEKDNISMWDLSVNAHYLLPVNKLFVYPLAGIGVLGTEATVEIPNMSYGGIIVPGSSNNTSSSDFAFNLGGGIEYPINENLSANFELKYKIAPDWNRTLLSAGIAYKF